MEPIEASRHAGVGVVRGHPIERYLLKLKFAIRYILCRRWTPSVTRVWRRCVRFTSRCWSVRRTRANPRHTQPSKLLPASTSKFRGVYPLDSVMWHSTIPRVLKSKARRIEFMSVMSFGPDVKLLFAGARKRCGATRAWSSCRSRTRASWN